MSVPVITRKMAEKAVKENDFKIKKGKLYSKKRAKKADKFEEKHGFRYEDAWNLDGAIARFILPRLVQLRDTSHGHPAEFADLGSDEGQKEWERILNEMINGFYLYVTKDWYDWTDEDKKVWFRAKSYFCRYFENLWD